MLPGNPLLELIAHDLNLPLIATSANISGSPIIFKDEDALEHLFHIADHIIGYNRAIIVPLDDSVVQVTKYTHQQIMVRRSRGYAPSFLHYRANTQRNILSTGAFLKSSFVLAINQNVFVSQFLGSGESYESQLMYQQTLQHWLNMYNTQPDVIMADLHPGYPSHQYAIALAEKHQAELKFVQHHQAHFAALLAEHNLLPTDEPILGIVWDGTGLGSDGNIWGGEFFKYADNQIERCCHFDYFPSIAGDKLATEPRIAALCATTGIIGQSNLLEHKFAQLEWNNYRSMINKAALFCSSVGRLFDAVASLLSICDKQSYEGEAAMYLQALAEGYVNTHGLSITGCYFDADTIRGNIPTAALMQRIASDIESGIAADYIAAKFHYSLVCLVDVVATNLGIASIGFSGGVFQNALLVDWIKYCYADKYNLYFHQALSPNDENISFGQLVYHDHEIGTPPLALETLITHQLYDKAI